MSQLGFFSPPPMRWLRWRTFGTPTDTDRQQQCTSGLVTCTRLVDGPCPDRATGGYLVGVLLRLKPGSLARRTDRHSITIGQGRKKTQKLVGVGARNNHSQRAPNNHTTCFQTLLGVQQPASHTNFTATRASTRTSGAPLACGLRVPKFRPKIAKTVGMGVHFYRSARAPINHTTCVRALLGGYVHGLYRTFTSPNDRTKKTRYVSVWSYA